MTILSKQYPMDLGTGTIEQVNQSAAKIDNEFTAIYGHLNNIRTRYRGATAPSNPEAGQVWEDTVNAVVKKWNGSVWEEETASSTNLTNRNTVLQGQVSSVGALELILGSTAALTADLVSSAIDTIIAIPAGHDDVMGNADYIVSFSATQTDFWTSLPANNTSRLFVDYSAGTVTGVYSVIAPVYQSYAPAHAAGLNWFNTNEEQWYLSDGSNWVAKYRCYVGSVVTDGTKVTATTIEPYNRIRANIIGTASLDVPLSYLDTDTALTANSDSKVATQKAVKAYADTKGAGLITVIQDQKAQNTQGGTFTAGAWRTRDLNTYQVNQIGLAALSSNQFVLPAGTYEILCFIPANGNVNAHQARLYNITDAADALVGSSMVCTTANLTTFSIIQGLITIAASKTFEVQHFCRSTVSTEGFGYAVNVTTEVYTTVLIRKVA